MTGYFLSAGLLAASGHVAFSRTFNQSDAFAANASFIAATQFDGCRSALHECHSLSKKCTSQTGSDHRDLSLSGSSGSSVAWTTLDP